MEKDKVLVVDDEAGVLHAICRVLRKLEIDVSTTTSPREALQMVEQESYALVISDQSMPEMDGISVLEKVQETSPETVRIMLTAHADMHAALGAINRSAVYRFLTKPWNDDELRHTVSDAVERFRLVRENKRLQALTEEQNLRLQEFNKTLTAKVFERTKQLTDLNQKLTNSFRGSLEVLGRLAELHSPALRNHAKRVATLSVAMGMRMGLLEDELFQLESAAILHDIGKIGMDPDILLKPNSKLTARNQAILLTHAVTGASLVQMVPDLEKAALFVRHHHERFDGQGFPDRLAGGNIPRESRIIAVADAYDNALNGTQAVGTVTREQALDEVRRGSEKQFDPDIVEMLARCMLAGGVDIVCDDELQVRLGELRTGMVLSRDVTTMSGITLLSKGDTVEDWHLPRLRRFHIADPVVGVYVYREMQQESSIPAERH